MTNEEAVRIMIAHQRALEDDTAIFSDKMQKVIAKDDEAFRMAISALERDRWIPVTERLPENKINPMTHDAYEYQCTANFGDETDVRCYKFWNGHWWHGSGNVDEYVTAWKERSEPYHPQELKYADADTAQCGLQPAT